MKWDATEGTRNTFTFAKCEEIFALAEKNGQKVRGHTLVWHPQLPGWVSNGGFGNATLVSVVGNHVAEVVKKWKGRILHWDVLNEIFNEDGTWDGTWRSSVSCNTIGEAFPGIAFRAARAADPSAKLYQRLQYRRHRSKVHSDVLYNLVKKLLAEGVPMDGIGVQAHLIVGNMPSTMQNNWARLASLGVDVAITELDIRMTFPADAAGLAQQAKDYKNVMGCVNVPRCVGITVWDYTDKCSWIPAVFPGQGAALPWDEDMVVKAVLEYMRLSLVRLPKLVARALTIWE